mgnify:CR=1 FL=1
MTVRVFHLITRFLRGGAETTTVNTLDALASAPETYELTLGYGAAYDHERVSTVADRGVETVRFRTIRHYNPVALLAAVGAVAVALRRRQIDVLHTHSTEAGIVGRYAAAIARTPVVIHEVHGDPVTADRPDAFNAFLTALERSAAPLSTTIVVKSERIKRVYLDRGIGRPEQYRTIYHGVDLERYRQESIETVPEKHATARLLFVGRLADGKGLFDLLEAVDRLRTDRSLEVLIVGEGDLESDLEATIRERGLEGTVSLLGYREDIPALLASSDSLVLPSYREGTPRVITEARAAGVPVVSTNIAGIPEQIRDGETGFLVTPGDVDALVERLSRLLDDDALRMSMAEQTRVNLDRFDVEQVQEQYRELYRELCREANIDVDRSPESVEGGE